MDFCLGDPDGSATVWSAGADTDFDGDGVFDAVGLDVDDDGFDDVLLDLDIDGMADHAVLDLDGDGTPEAYVTDDGTGTWAVAAERAGAALRWLGLDGVEHPASSAPDLDADGSPERLGDSDGNGLADRAFGDAQAWVDTDLDGRWDVRLSDGNGDGAADSVEYL
ncbi:pullulanase [Mycolicibacterium iranicum]|uniref:Pullulanase n=1 Tax=Mycolicibacterium iranicum TaxID=912594 RepID=A0A1X1WQ48_MYCIR|nr:pullulanase [Mycolicibacterium iranicum]MCZ0731973.1 pullulanase [Mycolicibacterium iranicum]ORV88650.1 pullulanase [Mycolicibacterium iranicum]